VELSSTAETQSEALRWFHARARRADPHLRLRHVFKDPLRRLRYARIARRGVDEYGGTARELWGLSPRRQFLRYLQCWRYGHTIEEFYYYGLGRPEWRPHAASFLSWRRMRALDRLYPARGVDVGLLQNKARFARHCFAAALPAIPTILELDGRVERWADGASPRAIASGGIIVKPRDGMGGDGVRAFDKVAGGYRDEAGRELAPAELIDGWKHESKRHALVVQPRVRNGAEGARWSRGGLCSVRVVTTRRGDEPPSLLLALLRVPAADAVVDNMYRGGLVSTIDPASGEVGPALSIRVTDVMRRAFVDRHPATGQTIAGCRLSGWDEIVGLSLRAHASLDGFHSIGWDIAMTDDGPLLIEGNHDWGVMIAQYPGPAPLGRTRLPQVIRDCFEAPARPEAT
jgi:hypothetical protein